MPFPMLEQFEKSKKSQIPKISDFEKHESNPFVDKAISEVKLRKKYRRSGTSKNSIMQLVNTKTGEIGGHTSIIDELTVDEERFAKLYISSFQAWLHLPQSALKVFAYVMSKLKPKLDTFEFSMAECQRFTGYASKRPVYEALGHLVKADIIARGYHEYVYFINPMIAFNGDRVSYIRTYKKEKSDILKGIYDKKTSSND